MILSISLQISEIKTSSSTFFILERRHRKNTTIF
jgi:hypothetical protein